MAVTLEQAKLNVQDALQMGVIDEFAKSNFIMRNIIFDNCVSPTGGGATLTYSYTRLKTQPTAAFRAINSEYTNQEVTKERVSVDLKVFGGAFKIDRVLAGMGGIVDEVTLQMQQKIKAASALFNDTVINGDSGQDENSFDGLEKALTGSSTEYKPEANIDLSTSAAVDTNWRVFVDTLDDFLSTLDGKPSMIAGNSKMINKIKACAKRAGQYQETKDNFGQKIESYDGIPLVDLGEKPGTNDPVVPISALEDDTKGTTSLYAVRFGLDAFHGVTITGNEFIRTWLPDFKTAGAVKQGEVEAIAAVALKATKSAGVLRKIKVA